MLHGEPVKRRVTLGEDGPRPVTLDVNYENAIAAVGRAAGSDNTTTRERQTKFLRWETCHVCHGSRLRPEALDQPARRPGPRRDLRALAGRAAGLRRRLRREGARGAAAAGRDALEGGGPAAGAARAARPRLPGARPRRLHAVDGRAPAPRADLDGPEQHHRHAVRPRRAVGRPAPEQRRRARGDDPRPRRRRELGGDGRARRRRDRRGRLGHRAGAGSRGGAAGRVIAEGSPDELRRHPTSIIGPFLHGERAVDRAKRPVDGPAIALEVDGLFNLRDLRVDVAGRRAHRVRRAVRGREERPRVRQPRPGPAPRRLAGERAPRARPPAGRSPGIRSLAEIDATPIGSNARSTPATYSGAMDADPQAVRGHAGGPTTRVAGRALLLQHRAGAVPGLPRARSPRPRRAVPARHPRDVPRAATARGTPPRSSRSPSTA